MVQSVLQLRVPCSAVVRVQGVCRATPNANRQVVGPSWVFVTEIREFDHVRVLRPSVKVLFMSDSTADESIQQGVCEEQVDSLHKPLLPGELIEQVTSLLADVRRHSRGARIPPLSLRSASGLASNPSRVAVRR